MAEDGRLVKMDVDYSSTVDERIPQAEKLAKEGKLSEGVEILMSLEKQTRTAADMHSTSRLLVAIVNICFQCKNWTALNENIITLTKRRSQLKQAVTKMVQECYAMVEQTPDKETKLALIETLRTVTAGKIYVEIERARLTLKLAAMKEADGDITGAASVLQELQVETFGSMERRERVEFILEQMRLCLAKDDYIRTQIISKKINIKFFDDTGTEELKLKYYKLMIELDQHEGSYLAVCKHYRAVYDTKGVKDDKAKAHEALKCAVLYAVLAPYDNEQSDLIQRLKLEKQLEEIPKYKEMLEVFTTEEVMRWKALCQQYEKEVRQGSAESPPTDVFDSNTEDGQKHWQDLKNRVVEHNIRVLAKYYTRMRLSRMADLLDLSPAEAEEFLCKMVVQKSVEAKADRLAGVVSFRRSQEPADVLNQWSHDLTRLMTLVKRSTHLINKEDMVHQMLAGAGGDQKTAAAATCGGQQQQKMAVDEPPPKPPQPTSG